MGKDKDKSKEGGALGGSGDTSREDLKGEHERLVAEEAGLATQCQEVRALFARLNDAYAASKESFSLNRYGQLKDMIKGTANAEVINGIKNSLQQQERNGGEGGKGGLAGLLKKAQEFSSESQQANQQEAKAEAKSGSKKSTGKMSSFMKKLKNATGFSDEPIADEDVMSNSELQRDNGRKQRAIRLYRMQLEKAVATLERLQRSYQASKSHAPPKRYQELKDMIKEVAAEKIF